MTRGVRLLAALALILLAGGAGWFWWDQQRQRLPDHIAAGNGRIEAEEIHVATKYGGRVAAVLVDEGDLVAAGQALARMDTAELDASLARAEAEVARAEQARSETVALIAQRRADLTLARQELDRTAFLVQKGHTAREQLDRRVAQRDAAQAALEAARAASSAAERAIAAAAAEARRIRAQIDDATLTAPRAGRVQYRLAEPGEVLAAGGRVVTLLDLTDVFMTIFLPTREAGRVFLNSEARIVLDAAPEYVIPGRVTFVASEAQFTPRQVETRTEREKLLFRVKIAIAPDLLREHIEKVKTGLPGVAYVRLGGDGEWPERLAVRLPPARPS